MRTWQLTTLLGLALLVPGGAARAVAIQGLYNTGVGESGIALGFGTTDPHYGRIVIQPHASWVGAPAGSAWIGASDGTVSDPAGWYYYSSITFDLSGLDHTTAQITGRIATDDSGGVFLNGVLTLISSPASTLTEFTLDGGFVPGLNTFTFAHLNADIGGAFNPTGILLVDLAGTAELPEPSTALLLLAGLVWSARGRFRRR